MMTPAESLTEAIDNLSQKKHVITKKALKAKYELENNMGATVAEKEAASMKPKESTKKEISKPEKLKVINNKNQEKAPLVEESNQKRIINTVEELKISADDYSDEIISPIDNVDNLDNIDKNEDIKINNFTTEKARGSVITNKQELLVREFNKNIHLLIAVFQRSKFDEVVWFLSRPGRMLFLNLFIGVIRGIGFMLGVLSILAVLASMAITSSPIVTQAQDFISAFSKLMF